MATFTQNGVSFTAVKGLITPAGKLSNGNNGTYSDANTDGVESFINAVEIDWNGADIRNANAITTLPAAINTTDEVLRIIKGLHNSLSGKQTAIGSTAIGTATNPVYWDGSKFVKTTYTLGKSVPSNAVFTDTVYTHPTFTAKSSGLYKITVDANGHVTSATAVTTSDLRALLDNVYQQIQQVAASISVTPTSATLSAYNSTQTFTATGGGSAVTSGTTWSITSGSSYATLSATSGSAVTITGKNTQATPTGAGSASLPSTSPTIAATGNTTIKCTASAASQTATTRTVKLSFNNTTATQFSPSSKEISISIPGQTAKSEVKSYAWSATSNASYVTLSGTTTNTVTITGKNTTSSNKTVELQCIVTWNNNATQTLTTSVLVKGVVSTDVFYFGTTKPTSSNYQSLTPKYTSSSQVYNQTATVTGGSTIYYLCPSSKALTDAQRKAAMLDQGGNVVKFSTTIDTTSISGYTIYQQAIDNNNVMKFNINY